MSTPSNGTERNQTVEYCCVCERETPHRKVDDDIFFENGLECLVCHTVWEAEEKYYE